MKYSILQRTSEAEMQGVFLAPEGDDATTEVQPRIQARSDEAGAGPRHLKGRFLLRKRLRMKFGFIVFRPASWLCETLGVSRSGFYAWLVREPNPRAHNDEELGLLGAHRRDPGAAGPVDVAIVDMPPVAAPYCGWRKLVSSAHKELLPNSESPTMLTGRHTAHPVVQVFFSDLHAKST